MKQEPNHHMRRDKPTGIPPPGYVCKLCNIEGHFIQECPDSSGNTFGRHSNSYDKNGAPPPGYVCNICKVSGHWIEKCPNKDGNNKGSGSRMPVNYRTGPHVPLQFARKIVCRVLSCPERLHWKSCVVPPTVETQLANEFKVAFKQFDWTLKEHE